MTVPRPNALKFFTLNNALIQMDDAKLGELHMRLNVLLMAPVKKLKAKTAGGLKTQGQQDILADGKQVWTTPAILLFFLQNTIELCTPAPSSPGDGTPQASMSPGSPAQETHQELKLKIPAWQDFKQLIYEIYDHRIYHAPEINGMINTNFMGMEEHLICFFV